MQVKDDGELMFDYFDYAVLIFHYRNVLKKYFAGLGDVEVVETGTKVSKQTTKFNQLMLTAYREFQSVTFEVISGLRKSMQLEVIQSMDLYAKKSMIRTLKQTYKFSKDELLFLSDIFYTIQYYKDNKKSQGHILEGDFKSFMSNVANWAVDSIDNDDSRQFPTTLATGNRFLSRLFKYLFDLDTDGLINFADIIRGLSTMIHTAGCLQLFFNIHDTEGIGKLSRENTIFFSETLLFLFRKLEGDAPLGAVSSFLNRAFMIPIKQEEGLQKDQSLNWFLTFETFQEVIVADDFLVEFMATFPSTFTLNDTKSGVYTTVKAPPLTEISDTILSGGLKWLNIGQAKKQKGDGVNSAAASAEVSSAAPIPEKDDDQGLMSEGTFNFFILFLTLNHS